MGLFLNLLRPRALAFLLILVIFIQALAADGSSGKTVRIAVYGSSLYAYKDADSTWRGLDIECLTNIALRSGFKTEFIDSANDPDFLSSLDRGVYDIVTDVTKTPERERRYLYSESELGASSAVLAVRASDDRWDYGNTEQLAQMKIGVVRSYSNSGEFRLWCSSRDLRPEIHEYRDIGAMTDALAKGEIDGEIYGALYGKNANRNLRIIMSFMPRPYYYVFRKGDMALKTSVDSALAQILMENPYYLSDLKNRYLNQVARQMPAFSNREKEYIAAHPVLRIAVLDRDMPYYSKSAGNLHKGILPDYNAQIAGLLGVKVEYSVYSSQKEAADAVLSGRDDAIGIFCAGIISAARDGLALTDGYSMANMAMLAPAGSDVSTIKRIAIIKRSADAIRNSLDESLCRAELVEYENAGECFSAMRSGRTDAIICGLPSATWILNQTNAAQYSLTPLPGMMLEFCGAVRADNRVLCDILNKCVAQTKQSFGSIVAHNTLQESSWTAFISRIPPGVIAAVIAVLAGLVIGLILALAALKKRQEEKTSILAAQAATEREKMQIEIINRNAEERNQFFSNISHDMRTPLNAIIGFSNLAESKAISPEVRDYLSKIRISGNLLLSLINDTLTISKIRNGKLSLHLEAVDTGEIAGAIVAAVGPNAEKKGIKLIVDDSGLKRRGILADILNIQKIVLNLLSNAVKFTPEGGHVWFLLSDDPQGASDPDILITVRDDGIGMTEEYQKHLYEPFTQEKRPGYESMGTGLGLSIVRQLVELMDGTIEVRSKKDKGTEFAIRLHFKEVGLPAAAMPDEPARLLNLSGKRILLCEDNQLNREIAVETLRAAGVSVDAVENGQLGFEAFDESPAGYFAAVLMDIRMPVLDGYAATKKIRGLGRPDAATIPIIAMTADAFEDDVQKCTEAGMNGHIAKPIEVDQMLRCISTAIK